MVHQDSSQKTWQYDTRCCRLVKKVGLDRTIHRSDLRLGLILNPNMPILLPASFGWNPEVPGAVRHLNTNNNLAFDYLRALIK
ncbi:hypothetical protein [Serratia fonticola]